MIMRLVVDSASKVDVVFDLVLGTVIIAGVAFFAQVIHRLKQT